MIYRYIVNEKKRAKASKGEHESQEDENMQLIYTVSKFGVLSR